MPRESMPIKTAVFKEKLQKELALLEQELKKVGIRNPSNPEDWEATPEKMDIMASDKNEVADGIEEFEEHSAVLRELEIQYNDVKSALKKIEEGKYGFCETDGEEISIDRLEVFPSARTCIEHANSSL